MSFFFFRLATKLRKCTKGNSCEETNKADWFHWMSRDILTRTLAPSFPIMQWDILFRLFLTTKQTIFPGLLKIKEKISYWRLGSARGFFLLTGRFLSPGVTRWLIVVNWLETNKDWLIKETKLQKYLHLCTLRCWICVYWHYYTMTMMEFIFVSCPTRKIQFLTFHQSCLSYFAVRS